jgi:hypothetical protein
LISVVAASGAVRSGSLPFFSAFTASFSMSV